LDIILFYHDLEVAGYADRNGNRFISVSYEGANAIIPHAMCYGKAESVLSTLADRGLVLPGPSAAKTLLERIYRVTEFEPTDVIARPGFANGQFTLGDGSVMGRDASRAMIAFSTDPLLFSEAGTLESWQHQVAGYIDGQHIPMMAMLLAFAAPLAAVTGITICSSIEFVGTSSSGIGILPYLLAGVSGAPARQVAQFAQLTHGPAGLSSYHHDLALPVVGSDVCLAGETPGRRALAIKNYLFSSHLYGDDTTRGGCLVSFPHQPLLSWADAATELSSLAADRHISIRVSDDRKLGIFDKLPKSCPDGAALTKRLASRARDHHGVALRPFLNYLMEASSTDLGTLNRLVLRRMNTIRRAAAGNRNNHCDAIITDTFAMAYAAGWIARQQGILPESWCVRKAVMRCYRRERYQAVPPRAFADVLQEIAAGDDVVEIGGSDPQTASLDTTKVFVKHGGRGTEVMIRSTAIYEVIPDWDRWVGMPSVKRMMVMEKGHLTVKRRLGDGTKPRMYCFRLTPSG
jgi:preprotein translocase subunit YajC